MSDSTSTEQSGDEGFRASLAVPGADAGEGIMPRATDDDVEGHVQPGPSDDAEGIMPRVDGAEGIMPRATDDEDDVEGHIKMRG